MHALNLIIHSLINMFETIFNEDGSLGFVFEEANGFELFGVFSQSFV